MSFFKYEHQSNHKGYTAYGISLAFRICLQAFVNTKYKAVAKQKNIIRLSYNTYCFVFDFLVFFETKVFEEQ